jgi:hypothetical protein
LATGSDSDARSAVTGSDSDARSAVINIESTVDVEVSIEEQRSSRLDLLPGGEITPDSGMITKPYTRAPYSHIHESTTGGIKARLAGAPDGVPYYTQVLPCDDSSLSLGVDVDTLASRNRMQRLTCDRQIATSWDSRSFIAKVMFTM